MLSPSRGSGTSVLPTQLPALPHSLRILLRAVELVQCRITMPEHLALRSNWVSLKLPNELLKPSVTDSKISCPSTTRRLTPVTAGVPLPYKPSDHSGELVEFGKREILAAVYCSPKVRQEAPCQQ
jgi:hypothetical protein